MKWDDVREFFGFACVLWGTVVGGIHPSHDYAYGAWCIALGLFWLRGER